MSLTARKRLSGKQEESHHVRIEETCARHFNLLESTWTHSLFQGSMVCVCVIGAINYNLSAGFMHLQNTQATDQSIHGMFGSPVPTERLQEPGCCSTHATRKAAPFS